MIYIDEQVLTTQTDHDSAERVARPTAGSVAPRFGGVSLMLDRSLTPARRRASPRVLVRVLAVLMVAALLVLTGARMEASRAPRMPEAVLAAARATRLGGTLEVEVGTGGEVVSCASAVSLKNVPGVCIANVQTRAPQAQIVSAMKEVVQGVTYYEIRTVSEGLRTDYLLTPAGEPAGEEEEVEPTRVPAGIVAAALVVVPDGAVVAVERVHGPESLGGVEFHVKKVLDGETLRIRVRDGRAVEVLRKLQMELKVGRDG